MFAIIMAGGEGTRLRPLTCRVPKPMASMLNKPLMEYTVEQLEASGIQDITATLMYRPEEIQGYFGDRIRYFIEEEPLGTAGGVKRAAGSPKDTLLVVSGDALTDFDFHAALAFHRDRNAVATLVLTRVENPQEFGVVVADAQGRVERFLEKPKTGDVLSDTINTGIYLLEPEALRHIPDGVYDFGKDLFPKLVKEGLPVYGYTAEGYWCDIGDIGAYMQAHRDILDGKLRNIRPPKEGIFIHASAYVDEGAHVAAPAVIGPGAVVRKGARIGPYTVLGQGAAVMEGASVSHSVLWEGATLDPGAEARGALLLTGAQLGRYAQAYEGSVVGERTIVGERTQLLPGALVWPHKEIEGGMRLQGSLVWGGKRSAPIRSRGARGGRSALGAEECSALGAALHSTLGDSCAVIDNASGAARAAADAFSAGFAGAGGRIFRLGSGAPQSLLFAMRQLELHAGCAVRLEDGALVLDLYAQKGVELSDGQMRSLKQAYQRRDIPPVALERVHLPVEVRGVRKQRCLEFRRMLGIEERMDRTIYVESRDAAIARELREMLEDLVHLADRPEGVPAIRVAPDGESFSLTDERGREMPASNRPQLFAMVASSLLPGEPLYLPMDASAAIETYAKEAGVETHRFRSTRHDMLLTLSGDDAAQSMWRSIYMDAAGAALLLCAYLDRIQMDLSTVLDEMEKTHMRVLTFPLREGEKAEVMRRLIERTRALRTTLDGGLRFEKDNGWAMLSPSDDQPEFRIVLEAYSSETADELTGFCIDLLQKRDEE